MQPTLSPEPVGQEPLIIGGKKPLIVGGKKPLIVGGKKHNKTYRKKRRGNKSLTAWVKFVKKVAREEKLPYRDAMMRAKVRKDKGEKWMSGGNDIKTVGMESKTVSDGMESEIRPDTVSDGMGSEIRPDTETDGMETEPVGGRRRRTRRNKSRRGSRRGSKKRR